MPQLKAADHENINITVHSLMIHDCFVVIYLQVGLDRSTLVAVIQLRCDYRTAKLANWFK